MNESNQKRNILADISKLTVQSFLVFLSVILFHSFILSQIIESKSRVLKQEEVTNVTLKNGVLTRFLQSKGTIHRNFKHNNFTQQNFSIDAKNITGITDTGMFQSVSGPYGGTVRSIVVDKGGWIFVATDGGVYKSTDNGAHWDTHPFPTQLFNFIEPLTVIGTNVIIAETDWNNFISKDRGNSWHYFFENAGGFAVDTNGDIYAGSSNDGLKKSTDTTNSWTTIALPGKTIWRVILCGEGKFVCPSDSGAYFSSDNGLTWILRRYENLYGNYIVSDRKNHLYSILGYKMYRSDDFGKSWQSILSASEEIYRINVESDGRVFAVLYTKILTSADTGVTWISLGSPADVPLAVSRDAKGNLLSGCFYGVFRYNEESGRWEEQNNGIHARYISAIQFTSLGSMIVYSTYQWFRSSDDGQSWSQIRFDSTGYPNNPIFSSSSGSLFIAAGFNSPNEAGFFRSRDDGISWERNSLPLNHHFVSGITEGVNGDILATTSFGDIYRTSNNGDDWYKVVSSNIQSRISCIASDKNGNYYALKDTTLLVSHGGIIWDTLPITGSHGWDRVMTIDKQGVVFVASPYNGINYSSDSGRTWNLMNNGLYNDYILSITADDNGNVIAGTGWGIFRLADSMNSWEHYSNGFPETFTTSVSISPQGYVFGGTQSYGIYKCDNLIGSRAPYVEPPHNEEILAFNLIQNYPNPFNNQTVIRFELPFNNKTEIKIYNMLGQTVTTLFSGVLSKGRHTVEWAPTQLASGLYFCKMTAQTSNSIYQRTIKLLYLR